MRTFAIVVVGILALILQASLWRFSPFEIVSLDLWAVFALYLGLHSESEGGPAIAGVAAMILGFVQDALAGAPSGLHASVAVGIALVGGQLSSRILLRGRIAVAGAGLIASLLGGIGVLTFLAFEGARVGFGFRLVWILSLQAFLTALASPPLFWVLRRVEARTSRTRARDLAREGILR